MEKKITLDQLTIDQRRAIAEGSRMFERTAYWVDATFLPNDPAVEALRQSIKNGREQLDSFFPELNLDELTTYDVIAALRWASKQPDAFNLQRIMNISMILQRGDRPTAEDMKFALQQVKEYRVSRLANGY